MQEPVRLVLIMKAFFLISILVLSFEGLKFVFQKFLGLEEFSMDKKIFIIFSGISNAFIAFIISVTAGDLLLSIRI